MKGTDTKRHIYTPIIGAICFVTGLLAGVYLLSGNGITRHPDATYAKLQQIMELIAHDYVDQVDTDSLLESSLSDIVAKLDPHSSYISAADLQSVNEDLDGSFCGVGISFNMLTDTITVLEVISGGPSEKAGIIAGDRIISINDTTVAGQHWSDQRVIKTLRGQRDTKVKLGIKRQNAPATLTFEVTRGDIPVTSVDASYLIDPTTGYLRINKFSRNTYSEFINAIVTLRSNGAKRYIIDLRGNGGGYMEPAILMANEFLPHGAPIVSTHGRNGKIEAPINADGTGAFQSEDAIVLIDEFSASASEILSGALQDNDRALIIGRRSFGKGLVQQQIDLPDHSALRLTVARYHTPSGRCIQKPYALGQSEKYQLELADRFRHGEDTNIDSVRLNTAQTYHTMGGREVYGGGGIMPDVYVPTDTSGITSYYISVYNAGLIQKFAFQYTDKHRSYLREAHNATQLLGMLPSSDEIIEEFAQYARIQAGIAPRWYYINISRDLIVSQIKALIARDILGTSAYYEVINQTDRTLLQSLRQMSMGNARAPIKFDTTKATSK